LLMDPLDTPNWRATSPRVIPTVAPRLQLFTPTGAARLHGYS
jgi:hypothetical protein